MPNVLAAVAKPNHMTPMTNAATSRVLRWRVQSITAAGRSEIAHGLTQGRLQRGRRRTGD
eukprot:79968-Hanusia_phi.AAC.1